MGKYTSDDALEDIEAILFMIDEIENEYPRVWDRGEDFLSDVREKVQGVKLSVENTDSVTENMARAIHNWSNGVMNWHPEYREE